MKKSLLFCIDSLDCAGAEKSLVSLLSLLDYSKFEVDLLLFSHGKLLERLLPVEVNILKPLKFTEFAELNLIDSVKYCIKNGSYKMMKSRIHYSLSIRIKNYTHPEKAIIYWDSVSKVIEQNPKKYDVAISFAQGIPTYYIGEKVIAKKKYAWVNTSYKLVGAIKDSQKKYYDNFDEIVTVSKSAYDVFLETFPNYERKTRVIYDINNPQFIFEMSKIGNGFVDNFNGIRILTIGRLTKQKGYDIALKACKKLRDHGLNFRWYVLGKGPMKEEIEKYILENDLSQHFILLGIDPNPYKFLKNSDIYVQTSRYEGFGLALAEARILNVPIVTTKFDSVYNQMIDGKNGLIVDIGANGVFNGIMQIISDDNLRNTIKRYLESEKKGNIDEIQKFYKLIG